MYFVSPRAFLDGRSARVLIDNVFVYYVILDGALVSMCRLDNAQSCTTHQAAQAEGEERATLGGTNEAVEREPQESAERARDAAQSGVRHWTARAFR